MSEKLITRLDELLSLQNPFYITRGKRNVFKVRIYDACEPNAKSVCGRSHRLHFAIKVALDKYKKSNR